MMLLVVLMLWACATIKAQQVFKDPVVLYKLYTTKDCTGDAYDTKVEIQGACIDTVDGSISFTCINNVPFIYSYNGSDTCTGKKSTSPVPYTTCYR